ncbi:MAG: hypothetical protein V3V63_04150 [Candidatus Hydrothermarchaeaceae archaeon]
MQILEFAQEVWEAVEVDSGAMPWRVPGVPIPPRRRLGSQPYLAQ